MFKSAIAVVAAVVSLASVAEAGRFNPDNGGDNNSKVIKGDYNVTEGDVRVWFDSRGTNRDHKLSWIHYQGKAVHLHNKNDRPESDNYSKNGARAWAFIVNKTAELAYAYGLDAHDIKLDHNASKDRISVQLTKDIVFVDTYSKSRATVTWEKGTELWDFTSSAYDSLKAGGNDREISRWIHHGANKAVNTIVDRKQKPSANDLPNRFVKQ